MPTSGNLKSGDSFFSITPPPTMTPPPHKHNNYSIQSLILQKVQTIAISLYKCNGKIIFVSDEIHPKMPQERTFESKKIQILGETGINSKLKHRKAHTVTRFYPGDLVTCMGDWEIVVVSGRLPDNLGKLACILFIR